LRRNIAQWIVAFSIIGILAAIAIPQFEEYGPCTRTMPQYAKSDLTNLWIACKAFFGDTDPNDQCSLDIAKREEYGFVPSAELKTYGIFDNKSFLEECHPGVTYMLEASGTERTFKATGLAYSKKLNVFYSYEINANGDIREINHEGP